MRPIPRLALLLLGLLAAGPAAQEPEWRLIRPSNTGIPGEQLHMAAVGPDDHLWVGGRYPFWGEGGVAEFDGTVWTTYANVDSPQPSEWVLDAAFADDGTVWFASVDGLLRKQGDAWTVWDAQNSPLPHDEVYRVALGHDGSVWMRAKKNASIGNVVVRFDGSSWTVWNTEQLGLSASADIWGPVVDKNGDVWVSSNAYAEGSGVARFDGTSWTKYDKPDGFPLSVASRLTTDDAGNLWLVWWKGIMTFDGTAFVDMPDPASGLGDWSDFRVHDASDYWVGTYAGVLVHWNGSGWQQLTEGGQALPSWVVSIDFAADGDLWVTTLNHGVKRFDLATFSWTTYNHRNTGLPSYFVSSFACDLDGNMWVTTGGGGAAQMIGTADDFHAATWRCFNADNAGSEPWPWDYGTPWGNDSAEAVVVDDHGDVWVAASGVGRWDGSAWELFVPQTSGISSQFSSDFLGWDALHQTLWVGFSIWGADRYDGTTWTHYTTSTGLPGNDVDDIAIGPDGAAYLATNGGLGRWADGAWTTITPPPSLPFSVTAVAVGPAGDLWLGTGGGLAHWDGSWSVYTKANSGLPANWINDVAIGPDGSVWVATFDAVVFPYQGGVSRFDGTTWTTWTKTDSPLPHNQVTDLAFDAAGNLWIACASEAIAVMLFPEPQVIVDLGHALPGAGTPALAAGGSLVAGTPLAMSLSGGPVGGTAHLVLGTALLEAPFKGGVLVPTPDLVLAGLPLDASGALGFGFTWPAGLPVGAATYWQAWMPDALGPVGFSASNALALVQP